MATTVSLDESQQPWAGARKPLGAWLGLIYALTILLSAFLLFQVQPLLTKWILPWFGGGPAVWTTCVLFFQSALFLGYAYAHLSERYLPRFGQVALHLGLIICAMLLLPIGPADSWKPSGEFDPTLKILVLLLVNIGVPYFLLSSTGPLVQAWFARAYPGRSPYRLYALSNLGSLAALLTYPFFFEPLWGLQKQSALWTWTFLVFASLYFLGAIVIWRVHRGESAAIPEDAVGGIAVPPATDSDAVATTPTKWQMLLWLALPAFASSMLLAFTNQLCQDMAVIPFLWILPLALYLISFIICFDHPRWYQRESFVTWTIVLTFSAAGMYCLHADRTVFFVLEILITVATLFVICMVCHGELVLLRPAPKYLTGYYLAISAGGALGGIWISLIAPRVFSTFLEWKIGIVVAYCAACALLVWSYRKRPRFCLYVFGPLAPVVGAGLICIFYFITPDRSNEELLESTRNFYGVLTVSDATYPDQKYRTLLNGRILHGKQFLDDENNFKPTTYYADNTGVGRTVGFFRPRSDMRVGVIGLGAGTMAAYGTLPTQKFRFYDINPEVIRLSKKYFTYLKDCKAQVDVILGDARLSLEREPSQKFHVLVLDAFSGDAIPTHLLTDEAMKVYLKHMADDSVIAIHISNRYLDLGPVVRGVAHKYGLKTVQVEAEGFDHVHSTWVLCMRPGPLYLELNKFADKDATDTSEILWTDDYSDLYSILRFRFADVKFALRDLWYKLLPEKPSKTVVPKKPDAT